MKITKEMAEATPVCACGGYVEAGDTLKTVAGTCNDRPAWWVECPDCGNALGNAHRENIHAQELGQIGGLAGAGKKKRLTPEEKDRRRARLAKIRKRRWPKK